MLNETTGEASADPTAAVAPVASISAERSKIIVGFFQMTSSGSADGRSTGERGATPRIAPVADDTPDLAGPSEARIRAIVLFGGRSAEHDVSRRSAATVIAALDPSRYDVVPVAIDRDGRWHAAEEALALVATGDVPADGLPTGGPVISDGAPSTAVLHTIEGRTTGRAGPQDWAATVVIPVLHGPNGEDGTVQGLLEIADVAYVGTGVLGSALAMDKAAAKHMLTAFGIPQARFIAAAEWELDAAMRDRIGETLGYPLFVKPANMGSSVGVSKVDDRAGLDAAVQAALAHDERLVFEETITGREIEIAVLGNESPRASVAGEIVPGADFYDYDDKYANDDAELLIPADLSPEEAADLARLAVDTYRALRCEGLARVDVFFESPGRGFLVNEVNTLPGFTSISMYPRLWKHSGLSYGELVDELVRLAIDRHRRRTRR